MGGEALRLSGIHAVGIANNVNYGTANIAAFIARLEEIGILHTGAGSNFSAARVPAIVSRNGLTVGFVQRSSVYWPTDHEARDGSPGIAIIRGHTAYQVPIGQIVAGYHRLTGRECRQWSSPGPTPPMSPSSAAT